MAGVSTLRSFQQPGGQRVNAGPWWKPWARRSAQVATVQTREPLHADPIAALPAYGTPMAPVGRPEAEEVSNPLDVEQAQFLTRLRQAGL